MLQRLDRTDRDVMVVEEQPSITRAAVDASPDYDDGLLARAGPVMAGSYGMAFVAALIIFSRDTEALFAVAISIGFAVVFFSIPTVFTLVRARYDARWSSDPVQRQSGQVKILTGMIRRSEALAQMVIIPISVAFAFCCFAVIWTMVHP